MKSHRAAISAAAALAAAPLALVGSPRNDAGAIQTAVAEMKGIIEANQAKAQKDWAELQAAWTSFQAETKNATRDVVSETKLAAINASIDKKIEEIKASTGVVSALDKKIEAALKDIDDLNSKVVRAALAGGGGDGMTPEVKAHADLFNLVFRKGEDDRAVRDAGGAQALHDLAVKAALQTNSNPDGGYTVTPAIEGAIDEVLKEVSPMRRLASVITIGTNEYKKLVNQHGTTSGWVGETQARPQTLASQLSELKFPVFELYAMPAATQQLLDDSTIDIASWISSEVELEFGYQEAIAFTTGDGVTRPKGFLAYNNVANASYSWGNVGYVATGSSGAFPAVPNGDTALIDLYTSLKSFYRRNSTWLMNRNTIGAVRKLKNNDGDPLIGMSLQRDGMVETLMGRPVEEFPDMPDIGANSYSIALGEWSRAYKIIDRKGITVLRDPFTSKPYVLFYTTKRVGGGISNFEALKLLKFSAS